MLSINNNRASSVELSVPRAQVRPDDSWIENTREKENESGENSDYDEDRIDWKEQELPVDEALEQFLHTMGNKVKGRRQGVPKRAAYQCRRMRCGAPSVTRHSFSEDDLVRFEMENDGFPIAANEEELRDFDDEVFSGDARVAVGDTGDEVKRKSRSKSLSEVAALTKLLKLPHVPSPSKPKFLDRLITGKGLSKKHTGGNRGKKCGQRLLSNQDSSVDRSDQSEDEEAELVSDCSPEKDGATGYLKLLQDSDDANVARGYHYGDIVASPQSEPCSPVLDREQLPEDSKSEQDAVSPPLSPILPGLVKLRCENFRRIHEDGTGQVVRTKFVERARSQDRVLSDSPRTRRCFSPVSEKADRLVKSFYSLSRDKSFSKAVMEKGYVRTMANQINTGTLPTVQTEDEEGEMREVDMEDNANNAYEGHNNEEPFGKREGQQRGRKPKRNEEVTKCECIRTQPSVNEQKSKRKDVPGRSPAVSPSNKKGDVGQKSPLLCHKGSKTGCSDTDTVANKEKTAWSPRVKRKEGDSPCCSPRSTSPAAVSKGQNVSSSPRSPLKSSTPVSPKALTKPSEGKTVADLSPKPKDSPQLAQSAKVNGESSAQGRASESADADTKKTSLSSASSFQNKMPVSPESAMDSECPQTAYVGPSGVYDNVFIGSNISPQELFDMSWSDSDSDEFSDIADEEDTITAQQVSATEEAPPSTPKDKLHQIALELLTTERAYVKRLNLLQQGFYFRIDQENRSQGFLPPETLMQMFSSIESIYKFHNEFLLRQMEERMKNWESERRIGDIIKKFAPFLKLYSAYVGNFDNAMNLINCWQEKSQKFASIIQEIQKLPECGSLTLQHHMLEPIQRVPRYELLLKDYLKVLAEDSPDRPDAQEALVLVTEAAKHSNEAMAKLEKFHKLLDIYQRLRGVALDFISPTRDFVQEGPIIKISARSGEKQSRYLFLFNDLLLICTDPLVGAYRVRAQLDVDGMEVKHGDNHAIPNTFLVHSKQKAIELLDEHPNSSSGGNWHELLKKVIGDHRNKKGSLRSDSALNSPTEESTPGRQAPRWIPDDAATMCMMCQVVFNAFRRRHHCRACGKLICKSCSKKAPLEYLGNKLERVCVNCRDAIVFSGRGGTKSSLSPTKKPGRLQVKADDPGLLAGYLQISDDAGKSWNKRWFALHEDFVMYFFRARQDVSAYNTLPLPGFIVERISDADKPNTVRVYHKSLNKKGMLFQADNEKSLKKWVNVLSKLVMAQLPDETQRLSSQSNSSSGSSGSDTNVVNNNNSSSITSNSDKLSQADSGFTADSICDDSIAESPCTVGDDDTDTSVLEKL